MDQLERITSSLQPSYDRFGIFTICTAKSDTAAQILWEFSKLGTKATIISYSGRRRSAARLKICSFLWSILKWNKNRGRLKPDEGRTAGASAESFCCSTRASDGEKLSYFTVTLAFDFYGMRA